MLRRHPLALMALAAAPMLITLEAARSQEAIPFSLMRATNVARMRAEKLNGGLTVYRPQACMFTTSADTNPCLIRSDEKGFLYRFLGGPPGWQAEGQPPTLETEILVSPEGNELVRVIYNGPPRRNLPR